MFKCSKKITAPSVRSAPDHSHFSDGRQIVPREQNCCMLDLSFGLPIVVRDAALKMVAPGPESSINREYYAQENEREIEEGRGGLEEYEKTDQKARELLRRLANSEPYYKRQRRLEATEDDEKTVVGADGQKRLSAGPGPIRTHDRQSYGSPSVARGGGIRGGRGGVRGGRAFPSTAQLPPGPQDILPPRDRNVTSLFVTGVEDDLPEHAIRTFFTPFGTLRSVVCSHRAHCAFINYASREGAEAAAEACQGKAVISGCPLRVQWGRPRPLDNMEKEERFATARQGRDTAAAVAAATRAGGASEFEGESSAFADEAGTGNMDAIAPPPGQDDVQYASLAGD
ncbi:Pre-mRNA-splicing factor slt11 [Xylographa opegraphella]|nr:Pre-mRNA-splicing factor slt11 [Xylographa opegraphella]